MLLQPIRSGRWNHAGSVLLGAAEAHLMAGRHPDEIDGVADEQELDADNGEEDEIYCDDDINDINVDSEQ